MEQGKSDNNYGNGICLFMLSVSGIVMVLIGLGIWKLVELIKTII